MSVIDDNWNVQYNLNELENTFFADFDRTICNIHENVLILLKDYSQKDRYVKNSTLNLKTEESDNAKGLQILLDKNKQLLHDIEIKLEALGQQQNKYETFKKDQKMLSEEIKETHEAFLMAKKFYKKFLKMYYTIEARKNEKQTIFVQFFSEAKKESENYSLRLLHHKKTGQYELLSTTPKLNILKDLQRRLSETNDVPEILCCIREAFSTMRFEKK